MAALPEPDDYPAGIYQLEDTDPVKGGPPNEATGDGMDNIPHAQLARRTRWLKVRVDTLIELVVAASTSVAGIVRLTNSTGSDSTTTAATAASVKAANDNANSRALAARTITGAGLAIGGGDGSANRTITVRAATQAEAQAGTATDRAMTPLGVAQYVSALFARSIAASGYITLPGGLIIQWLVVSVQAGNTSVQVTLPVTFPTLFRGAVGTRMAGMTPSESDVCAIENVSTSVVRLHRSAAPGTIASYFVIAIGM